MVRVVLRDHRSHLRADERGRQLQHPVPRSRRQRRREITEDSMRFAMRWLAAGTLVSVCLLARGSNEGRDVVGAQGSAKPTVIKRIYTGRDGLSQAEDIVLDAQSAMDKLESVEERIVVPS